MSLHLQERKLSNGIPVLFIPFEGDVATTYFWVQCGSKDERKGEEGFAHFLEHMLFKDASAKETGKASSGQTALQIESLGGDINAYTSFDQTVYHFTSADTHWEKILDIFGGMTEPQRFLKLDFEREREVILEELRKNEDSPSRQMFQTLFEKTFGKHPYGRPVIGYVKTLKAAKLAALEAFYKRNYCPSRMGIILVGPLSDEKRVARIMKTLEKHWSKHKGKPAPTAKPVTFRPGTKMQEAVIPFSVQSPSVTIGFKVPELNHEDIPALDLLAGVLAMGESSRLYQRLFYEKALVTEVSGGLYVPADPGLFYFNLEVPDLKGLQPAIHEWAQVIQAIRERPPERDEIERVLVNLESEKIYSHQTVDSVASRYGFLKFVLGDLKHDQLYIERLKALRPEDVRRVAERYLTPENTIWVTQLPKEDAARLGKWESGKAEISHAITRALKPIAATKLAKKLEVPAVILTPSKIKTIAHFQDRSEIFSVHAAVLGGVRLEHAPDRSGMSQALGMTWTKASARLKNLDILKIVEGRAASLEGFSGMNTLGLQLTGLTRDWEALSDMLAEVLWEPTFPEDEVEHTRRILQDNIRSVEDSSSQLCSKLFLQSLFEGHPYANPVSGNPQSVERFNSLLLREQFIAWVKPERLTLAISGGVSPAEWSRWLEKVELSWSQAHAARQAKAWSAEVMAIAPAPARLAALKAPRWVEKRLGREQVHILVGGMGLTLDSEERAVMRIMMNILGGQSGRLFVELRENQSLAYSVSPMSFEGIDAGYVGVYTACAPDKEKQALVGIRAVLEKLAKQGPTTAELKRAQEYFLGRRAMDLQGESSRSTYLGLETLYGRKIQTSAEVEHKIRAVTAKKVQELCRRLFIDAPQVTSVVG